MGSSILFILLLLITVVLLAGIFLMGKGGKANEKYGNKLMFARVGLQAAILILAALIMTTDK